MRLHLLGYPLSHSVSPAMHNAALQQIGLTDWEYTAFPVPAERLSEAIESLREETVLGANVTVPYKETVIPLLDGVTPTATAIGAVNTIVKQAGKLIGHNTDAAGLLADLYKQGVALDHRRLLILGAGGAARATVAAVASVAPHAKVRLIARRPAQAQALATQAQIPVSIFDWSPLGFLQASDNCQLILNTTPLGMSPNIHHMPWPDDTPFPLDAFVYDLIYNPSETLLVKHARAERLAATTGLGMLIEQGALAFELWTQHVAPRDAMRAAAEQALLTDNGSL